MQKSKMEERLYQTSEVMALLGLNRNTLRLYEKNGLLVPVQRSADNSYRSYSAADLRRLSRILLLKESGLALSEIREYLDGEKAPDALRDALTARRNALELCLHMLDARLENTVRRVTLPACTCLSEKLVDMHQLWEERCGETLYEAALAQNLEAAGTGCFALRTEEGLRLCLPVCGEGETLLALEEQEGLAAGCAADALASGEAALRAYAEQQGLTLCAPLRICPLPEERALLTCAFLPGAPTAAHIDTLPEEEPVSQEPEVEEEPVRRRRDIESFLL